MFYIGLCKKHALNQKNMIEKAIQYLDSEFVEEYNNLTKYNKDASLNLLSDIIFEVKVNFVLNRFMVIN